MAGELVGLSKFKLKLVALIAEARDIRDRERGAREELQLSIQRREQIEAEYTKKLQDLQAQIVSYEESQLVLESKIKYLEVEKDLLDKKEKGLKETINGLLQSRESFQHHYEDSTYQLKQSIQKKDRMIAVLTEKLGAQVQLFDSIEKEATAIKRVVNSVEDIVNRKEQEVTRLKRKVDQISTVEKDFVDKILYLEKKLGDYQLELRRREASIVELKENLETEKISRSFQPQIEELQKTLLVKDEFIQRLTTEKQMLHLQLGNMEATLRKLQDSLVDVNPQDKKLLMPPSVLGSQGISEMISTDKQVDSSKPCGSPAGAASLDIPAVASFSTPNGPQASIHHLDTENSVTDSEG